MKAFKQANDDAGYTMSSKNKLQANIQFQIHKLLTEPHMYDRFLTELNELSTKKKERVLREKFKSAHA